MKRTACPHFRRWKLASCLVLTAIFPLTSLAQDDLDELELDEDFADTVARIVEEDTEDAPATDDAAGAPPASTTDEITIDETDSVEIEIESIDTPTATSPADTTMPSIPSATAIPEDSETTEIVLPDTVGPGGETDTPAGATTIPDVGAGATAREFDNEDLSLVLRSLARQAGIDLVVSDQVIGTVTIRLTDKTALEAIEIIAESKGLLFEYDDETDVYTVKTAAEKAAEPQADAFYEFSYARAQDVAPLLQAQLQSQAAPIVDTRTNTIFYSEVRSELDNIKSFLDLLDRPTKQVMIEARLIETSANPQQTYGINWAGSVAGQTVSYGAGPFGVLEADGVDIDGDGLFDATNVTQEFEFNTDDQGNPLLGNFVAAAISPFDLLNNNPDGASTNNVFLGGDQGPTPLGGQFAILSLPQFSATLDLINTDSDAELLSNPRIVTADNEEAVIRITRLQPIPQLNFNEQTATAVFGGFEDREFGNTLRVLPQVNRDNRVTLTVVPEISNAVGEVNFTFAGAQVSSPIIDTRSLQSRVIIKSGHTLAVGGLLSDETSHTTTKVPILGDIPIVGYLFTHRSMSRTKRNLLIFVTPTILDDYYTGLEDQVQGFTDREPTFADPRGWRNNAKGAIQLVPKDTRHIAGDAPGPGIPPDQRQLHGDRDTLMNVNAPEYKADARPREF